MIERAVLFDDDYDMLNWSDWFHLRSANSA